MKKNIESLNSPLFKLTEYDSCAILGGGSGYSFENSWTNISDGSTVMDSKVYDICIDHE